MNLGSTSVLVVEDERIIARDLAQTLGELGYQVSAVASSGEEAISAAERQPPDVALLDVRIKGKLDGIDLSAILKRRFAVPVVFLTAHADEATLARAKLTEPYGYVVKPVKTAELRSAIEVAVYRHAVEKRVRERERWFSTTLQSIADAVITVDDAARVTFMNRAAESWTGFTAEQAGGKLVRDLVGAGRDGEETIVERVLREGRSLEAAEDLRLGAAGERLVTQSAAVVAEGGERLGAVLVLREVSERRRLQAQLEVANRMESLGTLAAGLAHEVNNPLAIISGSADIVRLQLMQLERESGATFKDDPAESRMARIQRALADIHTAGDRIGALVKELLEFSRGKASGSGEADVARCVAWALRGVAHELQPRARISTDIGDLPRVELDEARLGQVLLNLLLNAAHAIAPGRPELNQVEVTAHLLTLPTRVCLEVSDTGRGMDKDVLDKAFVPFFTTKDVGEGRGLGLAVSYGIVTSAGGQIEVRSKVNEGTVVRVTLPACARTRRTLATDSL